MKEAARRPRELLAKEFPEKIKGFLARVTEKNKI